MNILHVGISIVVLTYLSACSSGQGALESNRSGNFYGEIANTQPSRSSTTYNLKIVRLDAKRAIKFRIYLAEVIGITAVSSISIRTSERQLSLKTALGLSHIEEAIQNTLRNVGVDPNDFRLEMVGTNIHLENLR
jgi:hypothetical protein